MLRLHINKHIFNYYYYLFFITFMHGIYPYMPETRMCSVAAIL
jgi:hypothetical protein